MDPLQLKLQALNIIADITTDSQLEDFRIEYLSKKGLVNQMLQQITHIEPKKRAAFGKTANTVKQVITTEFEKKQKQLTTRTQTDNWVDVTFPGNRPAKGHLHLVSQTIAEITQIFEQIGFVRVRYPEIDWDWFAFEALNMPADHPARDEWETLFVDTKPHPKKGKMVLTPHTSNGQVREMIRLNSTPPIRMINIGKCYRRQQDISHTIMFHQFEGLVVDKHITIAHLKGTMDHFAKQFYGQERETRLRPFHFQFTEPSFEVDINCAVCLGKGKKNGKTCRTCKQGWVELGGSGMVHPNVLKAGGIDPTEYSGFAFGWGVERVCMMRDDLKIPDLRSMYQNDIRFLSQF